ncbi:MAG: threonine ammonia-lyase [Thermoleophilia bacterium]
MSGDGAPDLARILRAREAVAGHIRPTPVLRSRSIGERCGSQVTLKAENLQRTGSFKLRGALAKLATLPPGTPGVIAGSAGNHAQSLALAARTRGVPCEVVMPGDAAIAKVDAAASFGATVTLVPGPVDDAIARARDRAAATGAVVVHPFDDPDVIAGQGTLGIEIAEQVPDVARVVVPVGGGGLAAGIAVALAALKPGAAVVGVQAEGCAPVAAALSGSTAAADRPFPSIADGIAVKRPGALTLPILERHLDDVVTVGEEEIAAAVVMLLERSKLLVEGAGAVGVAAALAGRLPPLAAGPTVVVLSGGNIDVGLVEALTRRHETLAGRRLVVATRVGDRPGTLVALLRLVGDGGGNILEVDHVREGISLHVRETGVRLVIETRGEQHAQGLLAAMRDAGYAVEREPGGLDGAAASPLS